MKKRLLFVNHNSDLTGGANDDFERILRYFGNHKDKYVICGMFPNGPGANKFRKYCDEWDTYSPGFMPISNSGIIHYYGFFKIYFLQKRELDKILIGKKYDLCIINVVVLFWIALLFHKRELKTLIFIRENIKPDYVKRLYYKFMNKFGDYFIAVSDIIRKEFIEITGNNNIARIYSAVENNLEDGLDKQVFLEQIKEDSLEKILKKGPIFACIGSVGDNKNQYLILEAANLLKKRHIEPIFLFIGDLYDKNYKNKLLNYIKANDLKDSCHFLGIKDKNFIYNVLSYVTGLIISSKSEGLPLVLGESLYFKVPLITTKAGGISDIIVDGFNGLFINRNKESLAEAIVKIMNDKDLRDKLIENGLNTFKEKFDLNQNLIEINNIVDRLID